MVSRVFEDHWKRKTPNTSKTQRTDHGGHYRYPCFVVKADPCKTALGRLVPLVSYSVGRVNGVSIRVVPNHTVITCNNPLEGNILGIT
jgi:hypothetical protein